MLPRIISDSEELLYKDVATCLNRVIKHLSIFSVSLTFQSINTVLIIVS